MVEVFKTNVKENVHADTLLSTIHETLAGHRASFDLEDCDSILRIECNLEYINAPLVIELLERHGFMAEVLND